MMKHDFMLNYQPPQMDCWGVSDARSTEDPQYWKEAIEFWNLKEQFNSESNPDVAIIGYACDEGVRRNNGRVGAIGGPEKIRQRLTRLAYHSEKRIVDAGNVFCEGEELEKCQNAYSFLIQHFLSNGVFSIGLGGGHDIAFASFSGIYGEVQNRSQKKTGIINFDAHFDLRPVVDGPNSGTPFNQILNDNDDVQYMVLGIQKSSNRKELFDIALSKGVKFLDVSKCNLLNMEVIKNEVQEFIRSNDWIYLTIDLDGFSSAYAPGVSAPSPLGFTPEFVWNTLPIIFQSGKVISCDIAEFNPNYDLDDATANLAARLVDYIVGLV